MAQKRYNDLAGYLRQRFGCRVQKITVDAGMTCPNRDGTVGTGGCIYCNERGSGTGRSVEMTVAEQIADAQPFLLRRYGACKFLAYFQSFTNTYAPVPVLRRLYEEALSCEDIAGLTMGTRPDCVGEDVLDLLGELAGRTWVNVEYGLQSSHNRTLTLINRGHDVATFLDAVERTRRRNIDITVHVILGLPGETPEDMTATARFLSGIDIQAVKIHLLYVVRGTTLHRMYDHGEYMPMSRETYVDAVCDFIAHLRPDIVIHRLTGDPHADELVAPVWALEKHENLTAIRLAFEERDVYQGMNL